MLESVWHTNKTGEGGWNEKEGAWKLGRQKEQTSNETINILINEGLILMTYNLGKLRLLGCFIKGRITNYLQGRVNRPVINCPNAAV